MKKSFYFALFASLAIVLLIIPLMIYSGWAIAISWNWLIVPIFGLRELTTYQGMALALMFSYLTSEYPDRDPTKNTRLLIVVFVRPIILIGFAYVLKSYI